MFTTKHIKIKKEVIFIEKNSNYKYRCPPQPNHVKLQQFKYWFQPRGADYLSYRQPKTCYARKNDFLIVNDEYTHNIYPVTSIHFLS